MTKKSSKPYLVVKEDDTMSEVKETKLSVDRLRYVEYYGLQKTFDDLYQDSCQKKCFSNLLNLILSEENILLAYRNLKMNKGSNTAGTDNLTVKDIGKLTSVEVIEKVRFILIGSNHGYRPKPVRRKDIPKNGQPDKTRPLGIPCIWDRLIQQCIKQVLEPLCEAKFSENSHGFRPNRSVEHAIASTYRLIQQSNLHFVVEIDIKGFFDNVNHSKLIKQLWAMGIQDKKLIFILKRILKAPIKMPNGNIIVPNKGTPQGGIISPLLANVVLNEFDRWIESQWQDHPVTSKYSSKVNANGSINKGNGYEAMKKTALKEIRIIRYADDARIFCRTKIQAEKSKIAIVQWLQERLKLEVSEKKTRIINVRKKNMEFLGFRIGTYEKSNRRVVKSRMNKKVLHSIKVKLQIQMKEISSQDIKKPTIERIRKYNSMVAGIQNYYSLATNISLDCAYLDRNLAVIMMNRLGTNSSRSRLSKTGRKLSVYEQKRYGKSKLLRFDKATDEPFYPIGYIKHKNPMAKKLIVCSYTEIGRETIHKNLKLNVQLLHSLMSQPLLYRTVEYADNRISKFSAQRGKCAVTGMEFQTLSDIHCHHILPKCMGGTDKYANLILVLDTVHILVHATNQKKMSEYLNILKLPKESLDKLNTLRKNLNLEIITT